MVEMLNIVDSEKVYRVRKEEEGCSIFGPGCFVEGNDIIFDILKMFENVGVEQGYQRILEMYQVEPQILRRDLLEMAEEFEDCNIFMEMAGNIKEVLLGECK